MKANETENILKQLTDLALEAATQGKWDAVVRLYDRRARAGSLETVSPDVAKTLIHVDEWIMTRIQEVQILIQQQLEGAQQDRRKLKGLKGQWAGQFPVQARHRLSI